MATAAAGQRDRRLPIKLKKRDEFDAHVRQVAKEMREHFRRISPRFDHKIVAIEGGMECRLVWSRSRPWLRIRKALAIDVIYAKDTSPEGVNEIAMQARISFTKYCQDKHIGGTYSDITMKREKENT